MLTTIKIHTGDEIRNASSYKAAAEMIRHNLQHSDRTLFRGILAIYARQTMDEQNTETTQHHNKIGFSGIDAQILSSFAKQIQKWNDTPPEKRKYPTSLSSKQMGLARRRMSKYAMQLARIARPAPVREEEQD